MEYRVIDEELLPVFRSYLLAEAAEAVAQGRTEVLAVGAVTDDWRSCGAAAALREEGEVTLFSFYVDEAVRRQGIGSALLDRLEEELGTSLSDVRCFLPEEGCRPLADLLEKRGFSPLEPEGGDVMRLDTRIMRQLPMVRRAFSPTFRPDANVVPGAEFTPEEIAEVLSDEEILPSLRLDRFTREQLTSPLSFGYRYGGRIVAYFLAQAVPGGASVLAAVSRKGAHGGAFFQLAMAAIHSSLPDLPSGEGSYWIEGYSRDGEVMARYFCRDEFQLWREYHARRWEAADGADGTPREMR